MLIRELQGTCQFQLNLARHSNFMDVIKHFWECLCSIPITDFESSRLSIASAHAFLLVFSVTDPTSFAGVRQRFEEIREQRSDYQVNPKKQTIGAFNCQFALKKNVHFVWSCPKKLAIFLASSIKAGNNHAYLSCSKKGKKKQSFGVWSRATFATLANFAVLSPILCFFCCQLLENFGLEWF